MPVESVAATTDCGRADAHARRPALDGFGFGAGDCRTVERRRACARSLCSPTVNPSTGQTVTCDSSQPNPVTTAIVSQPGSTNVTVNMLSGAQLNVGSGDALVLGGGGQITNSSGAIIQGVRGVNFTGPGGIANDGQISGNGGPGVVLNGPGDIILTNTGQINGSGGAAVQ